MKHFSAAVLAGTASPRARSQSVADFMIEGLWQIEMDAILGDPQQDDWSIA